MSSIRDLSLLVSASRISAGLLFFIAVEFDGRGIVARFGKSEVDVSLMARHSCFTL